MTETKKSKNYVDEGWGINITGGYAKSWGQEDQNGNLKPELQFWTFNTQEDVDNFLNIIVPKVKVGSRFIADPTPASIKAANSKAPDYNLRFESKEVVTKRQPKSKKVAPRAAAAEPGVLD